MQVISNIKNSNNYTETNKTSLREINKVWKNAGMCYLGFKSQYC